MRNSITTITLCLSLLGGCDPDILPDTGGTPVATTGEMGSTGEEPTTGNIPPECEGKVPVIQPHLEQYNSCPPEIAGEGCWTMNCAKAPAGSEGIQDQCTPNCGNGLDCPEGGVCKDKDEMGNGYCYMSCGPCLQCPETHLCNPSDGVCWPKA